jgi:TonB-dependent starch-binding outer membrane protein SusC
MHRARLRAALLAVLGLTMAAVTAPPPAAAQATGSVRGSVLEEGTRRPLTGVQVFIRGTQRGRLTDLNGNYIIPDVPVGTGVTVRVESIGYRSTEVTVTVTAGEATVANFELQPSAVGLDEIVVTGTAGRTTRRALGNSVSTVQAAQITEVASVTNMQQLLQGRTAGVTMTSSTGVVGGSSRLRIRGSNSLNAGNNPVVYVDGVRVQSGTVSTEGNTAQGYNLLEAFNPNDIESIEVIKGPAAATLYGADAATGVIQIITKKGRPAEGLQWTANMEFGRVDWSVDQITNYWLCTDFRMSNLNANPGCRVFDPSQPLAERLLVDKPLVPGARSLAVQQQYRDRAAAARAAGNERLARAFETEDYPCLYPEQQPCDPRPLRIGDTRNLNLSVRGGGESYNFFISGETNEENGTFYNNFNNRKGGRANFGFVPSQITNFNVNVGYAVISTMIPQSDNSSNSVLRNSYRGQAGGASSQYLPGFRNMHPEFSNKYIREIGQERLTLGITGNYNPFSWWQNKLTVGLDRSDRKNDWMRDIDATGLQPFGAVSATGSRSIAFNEVHLWTVDYAGTLTRDITDQFSSAFSGGMQLTKRRSNSNSISGDGMVANQLNLISAMANRSAGQGFSEQTSLGFFVQEQVGWRDRLFATAAVRVDDNSAFGSEFSMVVYPKASLSYVISEEPFFNIDWVEDLKLRVAWGQAGNAPAPFSADRTYSAGRAVVADDAVNTLITNEYGNPNLKAETGSELEVGFESSLLRGRLGLSFSAYHNVTRDALLSISDPPSSGWISSHLVNVGEIKNTGLELTVDATLIRSPRLSWDIAASAGTNNNELVSFGVDAQGNPTLYETRFGPFLSTQRHREGYPIGGFWATDVQRDANGRPILAGAGVNTNCISATGAFNCSAPVVQCVWDPTDPSAVCDEEFIGSPFPTRSLGLTNTIRILGNLQIHSFMDFQGGFYQWCAICSVRTRLDGNSLEINDTRLDPSASDWTTYGMYERARLLSLQTKEHIYPADFMKLRELGVTYTIPRRFLQGAGFSRATVTMSGRNLAIWTKYKGGSDPEVAFSSTSAFEVADYGSIPMQRRLVLSTSFSF